MVARRFARTTSRCRSYSLLTCAVLLAAFGGLLTAQTPTPPQESAPAQKPTPEQSDAAAKSLARKQRFEELKKRLEAGETNPSESTTGPSQTLFVSPAQVGMLVNDEQAFSVFDIEGRDWTAKAEWSLSNSYVANLSPGAVPFIRAKDYGTVTVRARIGSQDAVAEVRVYSGNKLIPGTIRWSAPKIPGYHTTKLSQAPPTANGPDVYLADESDDGKTTLIRALFSDGRQKWMNRIEGKVDKLTGPLILQSKPL